MARIRRCTVPHAAMRACCTHPLGTMEVGARIRGSGCNPQFVHLQNLAWHRGRLANVEGQRCELRHNVRDGSRDSSSSSSVPGASRPCWQTLRFGQHLVCTHRLERQHRDREIKHNCVFGATNFAQVWAVAKLSVSSFCSTQGEMPNASFIAATQTMAAIKASNPR